MGEQNVFKKRPPELPNEATDRERELAAKYTKVSFILVPTDEHELGYEPDAAIAWFVVGNQSFRLTPFSCESTEEASWNCWMFAKAFAKALDDERDAKLKEADRG